MRDLSLHVYPSFSVDTDPRYRGSTLPMSASTASCFESRLKQLIARGPRSPAVLCDRFGRSCGPMADRRSVPHANGHDLNKPGV